MIRLTTWLMIKFNNWKWNILVRVCFGCSSSKYCPRVKLERTNYNRVNGVLDNCPCPVHHNPDDTGVIVFLDKRLRVNSRSCRATRTLPQLLENYEIDPADVLQHTLENLDQLQQRFELLDPDIEEELTRSWHRDESLTSIDLPILGSTTLINPLLSP